jgi:hypothetical protein
MSLGSYLVGWVLLAALLGCVGTAAWLAVRARMAWMAIEARLVAWALLASAGIAVSNQVPLMLGLLTRVTPVVVAALLLAAAMQLRPAAQQPEREAPRGVPGDVATWAAAALAIFLALVYALAFLRVNRYSAIADVDSTGFHLPNVARWIQDGSLWHLNDFIPGWAFGAYPETGNLIQVAVILPWHDDFLLRAVNPCFLGLATLVVYAIACELGAARSLAAALAATAVMTPVAVVTGLNHGQTDMEAAAWLAGGALFLVRHARTGQAAELWLAAVGLGLAFGTKWWGPPEAAALIVVWIVARVAVRRRAELRPALRDPAWVGLGAVALGGIWLVRNLVLTGDPVFPGRVAPLGIEIFEGAPAQGLPYSFSVFHYVTDVHLMRVGIWPQLVKAFAAPGGLALLGAIATALFAWRRRAGVVTAVALAALVLTVVWARLPYTAQGPEGLPQVTAGARYAMPAIFLALAALAWLSTRIGRSALAVQAIAIVAILHAFHHDRTWGPEFKAVDLSSFVTTALITLVAATVVTWLVARRRDALRPLAPALAALALVAVVVAGRPAQQNFDDARYRVGPVLTWLQAVPKRSLDVAIVGALGDRLRYSGQIATFGPRMRNRVDYVGPRRKHLLADYERYADFERALAGGGYDALVVGYQPGEKPKQLAWSRRAGWTPVLSDRRYTLLRPPSSAAG